jgi:hypothetical protein
VAISVISADSTGLTFQKLSVIETPYEKPADTYQSGSFALGRNLYRTKSAGCKAVENRYRLPIVKHADRIYSKPATAR